MAAAMPVIHASVADIAADRDRFERDLETVMATDAALDDPLEAGLGSSFFLAYHGLNNRALQERLAAAYLKLCPALAWQAPAELERFFESVVPVPEATSDASSD